MGLRLKLSSSTYSHCPNNHSVEQVMMMMAIMVIHMMVLMMVMLTRPHKLVMNVLLPLYILKQQQ